ncbi:substrate-binding domain-containing protein [Pusillimonas noertemannii]|uniref:substrate-binding domain-containing protein n=1 Tax=Pusillimonas noertemannii TaxID=305977 RepID=UPI0002F2638C|nr:substrate-binding domain-containing protein [Pusillimonas noertemannii]
MMLLEKRKAVVSGAAAISLLAGVFAMGGAAAQSTPDIVKEMRQFIADNSARPAFTPPGPPLDASKLKGKTISIQMIDGRIGAIKDVADAVQEAAAQAGLKTTVFDAKSSPVRMQQGFQEAINAGADAIVNDGDVVQIIANQIKAAKDKGIPTVEAINSPPVVGVPGQGSDPNTFGNVAPDAFLAGQLSAAAAVVNTEGKAQVVIMNTSEVSASPTIVKGMKDVLERCPDCSIVQITDTPLEQWSTALTGLAATTVRSKPQVNYLLPIYSDMGIFAAAGIQQAGATGRVHIASFNGTPAAQALVKKGDIYAVNTAEDHEFIGWAVVDQAMRGMLGMEPAHPIAPIRYVGTKDLKDIDTSSSKALSLALFGDDYKEGFLKLWGLK